MAEMKTLTIGETTYEIVDEKARNEKLNASALPTAINTALAQAKASGEFDGKDGKNGSNGKDGTSATHSWNGTVLTVTSASGTSSADLKGEKGDKGDSIKGDTGASGTSVTVKSVSESTADGGSNVVTFSDGKTLTVKNGGKGSTGAAGKNGADGYTPVRGTDYWTQDDREAIVSEVIDLLGGTPIFGTVDAQNNIILSGKLADGTYVLKYEDAEGNVTEVGQIYLGASYTNLADPSSADWLTDKRLNSSAEVKDQTGCYVTNYIPVKKGDVVRVRGLEIRYYYGNSNATTHFYNASKTKILSATPATAPGNFVLSGTETVYTVGNGLTGDTASIAYVRFVGILYSGYTVDDVIITVNEEITE